VSFKHLLKHNVAKISEALPWAQPYIQPKEAMKASSNPSIMGQMSETNQAQPITA